MIERKLMIFRMAAELGNFTEAAAALGMTQPNVSSQISILEQELRVSLFERDGRQVHLTESGRVLLEETEQLIASAQDITHKVRCAAKGIKSYRIGATMTAGAYVLPALLAVFMEENPDCNLSVHIGNTGEISEMLEMHRLDLGLIEGPFDGNCCFSSFLLQDELKVVAAPGRISAKGFKLANYLASGGRFILRESGSGTRHHFDNYLEELNLPMPEETAIVEANNFETIKNLVRSGFGITVISELAVADEISSGLLEAFRAAEGALYRDMNFIYHPAGDIKFAERFINFCTVLRNRAKRKTAPPKRSHI